MLNKPSDSVKCGCCGLTTKSLPLNSCDDYITGHTFSLYRCDNCSVVFTYPIPKTLETYYPREYRKYGSSTMKVLSLLYHRKAREWTRKLKPTSSKSVLEIGCGPGIMLNAFQQLGWDTLGLERNEEMARNARISFGLNVKSCALSELNTSEKFDLIILYNVLEHLTDPSEILKECSKRLTDSGILLITVPNYNCWQRIFGGKYWLHLDVPRHLFHFERSSIGKVLQYTNLNVSHMRASSLMLDYYGWIETSISLMGFGRNIITRWLSGLKQPLIPQFLALFLAPIVGILVLPIVFLSVIFKRSALLEFSLNNSQGLSRD